MWCKGNFKIDCEVNKLAYTDDQVKVKRHSTRSIGPSWPLFNSASIKAILEAAE